MKLLICTQAVDREDLALGFFVRWIEEIATHCEHVTVICLKKGNFTLPGNVSVYSLGKEEGVRKIGRIVRFYRYIFSLRGDYEKVFIHMNEEYVLLGGPFWRIVGKDIFLWRNHHVGSWLTIAAAFLCKKLFCTSVHSYTARFRHTVLMPVGVDVAHFTSKGGRVPCSILFTGRFTPSKRPHLLVEALGALHKKGIAFTASIYGSALEKDAVYFNETRRQATALGLQEVVHFYPGVPHTEQPRIMSSHELFVNLSASGMFDKTLFEAAACGCLVVAMSKDWQALLGEDQEGGTFLDPDALAGLLSSTLALSPAEKDKQRALLQKIVEKNTLSRTVQRLVTEIL